MGMADVVLAAVDQAVRDGHVDPDRVGVLGFSGGAHSALQLITQTTRFKAAVAAVGISNFVSQYGAIPLHARLLQDTFDVGNAARFENPPFTTWSYNSLGAKLWEDPLRYVRNSPALHADRINTPLLLMHSDFDVFPLNQSQEMFAGLYRLRKEAEYVTYWGEGHVNLSPANIRDWWTRVITWYEKYLQ